MPRAVINVHSFLQECNPSKFIVYSSLLAFSILFSARLDNRLTLSYWLIFVPLWIWKTITVLGALVGVIVCLRNPEYRVSRASYVHFKSMLISTALQLLLLMFEILVCDKLESRRHTWSLCFIPLIFVSLISISICVWSIKNGRGIELEFFAAVNILQIVLIALKLDNFINWTWVVVFVPTWILLSFATIIVLYALAFVAIILRSPEAELDQRRASIHSASSSSLIFLPILMFMILLTSKLDSPSNVHAPSYTFTFLPLFFALTILIKMSFGSKSGSLWWFGMRSDFCTFLLTVCPCLREYGNTSFVMNHPFNDTIADGSPANTTTDSTNSNPLDGGPTIHSSTDSEYLRRCSERRRLESGPKRFLHSLSRVFYRDKMQGCEDEEWKQCPIGTKLNIDTPD